MSSQVSFTFYRVALEIDPDVLAASESYLLFRNHPQSIYLSEHCRVWPGHHGEYAGLTGGIAGLESRELAQEWGEACLPELERYFGASVGYRVEEQELQVTPARAASFRRTVSEKSEIVRHRLRNGNFNPDSRPRLYSRPNRRETDPGSVDGVYDWLARDFDDEDEDPREQVRDLVRIRQFEMTGSVRREDALRGLTEKQRRYFERGASPAHTAMKGLARDWLVRKIRSSNVYFEATLLCPSPRDDGSLPGLGGHAGLWIGPQVVLAGSGYGLPEGFRGVSQVADVYYAPGKPVNYRGRGERHECHHDGWIVEVGATAPSSLLEPLIYEVVSKAIWMPYPTQMGQRDAGPDLEMSLAQAPDGQATFTAYEVTIKSWATAQLYR